MAKSWKARHRELADAIRAERDARRVGGDELRRAVATVNRLLRTTEQDDADQEGTA